MRLLRLLEVRGAVLASCPKSPLVLGPCRRSRRTRSGSSLLQVPGGRRCWAGCAGHAWHTHSLLLACQPCDAWCHACCFQLDRHVHASCPLTGQTGFVKACASTSMAILTYLMAQHKSFVSRLATTLNAILSATGQQSMSSCVAQTGQEAGIRKRSLSA